MDPYKVLGVAKSASQDEIKKAYHKLARKLHPDLNPGDKASEERFKQVSVANDLLSDADKRARFDRGEIDAQGQERAARAGNWRSYAESRGGGGKYSNFGFDFGTADEIFEELLRRRERGRGKPGAGPGAGGGAEFKARGQDAQYSLRVDFPEAAAGAAKRITLPNGRTLNVRIPPGTEDGQTLRLKGQGQAGMGTGEAGDALIEIKVDPHPFFVRQGYDVHVEVPVSLPEAVLGGKITVPTIDGKVTVTVPPASNTGTQLRLKGRGIPHGKERGDQLVKLKVILPDRPDPDLESFVRGWAERHGYDVRTKVGMA